MTRLTGTWILVRLMLRRDRVRLPVWLTSLVGLMGWSAAAVQGIYDTPAERAAYATTVGNSGASIAMSGPPVALDTLGGIAVFETSQVAIVGISLMVIFLTLRHTRADEEAGRTELLRAGVLGRNADLAAILLVMSAASLVVGSGLAAAFLATGLPVGGSLLFGAAMATLGVVFTGVALVAAQVTQHNRGAIGLSLTALGVLYGLRAIGDVNDSWLTWLSPIGWVQAVHAFADDQPWPLGPALALAAGLTVLAAWLTTRRDLGGGLVQDTPGAPDASRLLSSPLGLAARLQRSSILGWVVGMAALGAVYGSFGQDVLDMIEGNPDLAKYFEQVSGGASVTDSYFGIITMFDALIAAGFTVSSVLRLRTEEGELRAEPLLATPVSRLRWTVSWLAVTTLGTVAVLGACGLAAGVVWSVQSSDPGQVPSLALASLSYLPALLALGGLAFLLFGWLPRGSGFAWAATGICFVLGWMGDLLSLPGWVLDVSPFAHIPLVPTVDFEAAPLLVVGGVALALALAGLTGFRRRDLLTA